MMIVAGVVFVSVMDGIALFNRFAGLKVRQITGNMRLWEGYYHLRDLAAAADSVAEEGGELRLFRKHAAIADLSETDSLLIARYGPRTDILLSGVSEFTFVASRELAGADTIRLAVRNLDGGVLLLSFPVAPPAHELLVKNLREQEIPYEYE